MNTMTQAQAYKLVNSKAVQMLNEIKLQGLFDKDKANFAEYLSGVRDITAKAPKNLDNAIKYWEKKAKESNLQYVKAKFIALLTVKKVLTVNKEITSKQNCPGHNTWQCREIDCNCAECALSC